MREILFRGKHSEKSMLWNYGDLYVDHDKVYIGMRETMQGVRVHGEVIPETVGQYTGLTDKNGKKIFEGDILSTHFDFNNPEVESRTVVEWGNFRWVTHQPGYEPDDITDFDKGLWTVIGNIYDNPELIGGELHG